MRRIALPLALTVAYVAFWAYGSTHGGAFPTLSTTAEVWGFALCGIALHIAIGYLIGNPWAIALAATPALTLIPTDDREWLPLLMLHWGVPIAASIAVGVLIKHHRERLLRAVRAGDARRIGLPLALAAVYVAFWAYAWTPGGDDLPNVSTTAGAWAFALGAIAVHIAIGYLIGNPWAIALAAAPALTLITAGDTGVLPVVMIVEGVPIAAFIAVGVLLKRHRETPSHAL